MPRYNAFNSPSAFGIEILMAMRHVLDVIRKYLNAFLSDRYVERRCQRA